ncbi:MAG: NPCBM/NEW2 domain-containing protein [Noviherbaspirillum sp.]
MSSNVATLTVTNNRLPTATIDSPTEDGALPPSAMTWQVAFMHDTHSHPFLAPVSGAASGSFQVSDFEADAANTWFRLTLTVQDSLGQSKSVTRDVYPRDQLSEMTPAGTPINGRGPIERNRSNGDVAEGDGGTLTLDRIPYAKGVGVHAPSDVRYQLDGNCTGRFIADVGIDDAVGDQGSVVFQVLLDGVKLFDSGVMRGGDLRKTVNLGVAGKNELRLVVTDGGDGNTFDQADRAGARVTGCPAPVAAQPAAGPALASPMGGGGCSMGGDGRFDPTLPGLLALALGMLIWRRHRKS